MKFEIPQSDIFCYFLRHDCPTFYYRIARDTSQLTGLDDVITCGCYNRSLALGNRRLYQDADPYDWVYLLQHAPHICTDSLHATLFALKLRTRIVHALQTDHGETGPQSTLLNDRLGLD
jgi:Polysaccharide pyruvyl transferase.